MHLIQTMLRDGMTIASVKRKEYDAKTYKVFFG
jgi:hypothetical protein